jgi:hypothetical protein
MRGTEKLKTNAKRKITKETSISIEMQDRCSSVNSG